MQKNKKVIPFGADSIPKGLKFLYKRAHLRHFNSKKVLEIHRGVCYNMKSPLLPMAQLDSASDSDSEGPRFESAWVGQQKSSPFGGLFLLASTSDLNPHRCRSYRMMRHIPRWGKKAARLAIAVWGRQGVSSYKTLGVL